MDEFEELIGQIGATIETKIKEAGYPKEINGVEFYREISAESEGKENGDCMFHLKKEENLIYEGSMTIYDDEFDLHYVDIIAGDKKYHINFDDEE